MPTQISTSAASSSSGALVVFAGQSNMGAPYEDTSTVTSAWTPDPLTQIWDDATGKWEELQPGVNTGYAGAPSGWGPEVQFAIDFRAAHPGETLYIVKSVAGGTQLAVDSQQYASDWSPQSPGELFDQTTQMIGRASAAAGGLAPSTVFWGQGEEDANYQATASAYGQNLSALFTAIRASWLHDSAGKIGLFEIGISPTYSSLVRSGEQSVLKADSNAAGFDTASFPLQPDGLHYAPPGLNSAGDDFFQLYQGWTQSTPVVSNTSGNQQSLTALSPQTAVLGGGYDVLDLSHNPIAAASSAYTMAPNGNGSFNLTTAGSSDHVSGVLQVAFSDKAVTVASTDSPAEYTALLYQGALDRTPDAPGLAGWIKTFTAAPDFREIPGPFGLSDVSGGYNGSLSIAAGLTNSPEFQSKYGNLTNGQFVTTLYANILDRPPDTPGFNGWMSQLGSGMTREHILVGFADSPEAITNATVGFTGQNGYHALWLFLT